MYVYFQLEIGAKGTSDEKSKQPHCDLAFRGRFSLKFLKIWSNLDSQTCHINLTAQNPLYMLRILKTVTTFERLSEKIIGFYFMCVDREDFGLSASFCFTRIGPGIIEILAIKRQVSGLNLVENALELGLLCVKQAI